MFNCAALSGGVYKRILHVYFIQGSRNLDFTVQIPSIIVQGTVHKGALTPEYSSPVNAKAKEKSTSRFASAYRMKQMASSAPAIKGNPHRAPNTVSTMTKGRKCMLSDSNHNYHSLLLVVTLKEYCRQWNSSS